MTEICALPDFSVEQASEFVERLYGLRGTLEVLNGERDLNFLLHTETGKFVFKIANQDETHGILECQHRVMQRLLAENVMPEQASSLVSINGRVIEIITSGSDISHYCRVLNYVEGRLLSSMNRHTPELLGELGRTLARIDLSLQGFSHEALDRPLLWNMCDALATLERFKPLLVSNHKRKLIEYFEAHFRDCVLPLSGDLRKAVIHNDANDNNVLIAVDQAPGQHIASIIDFGDMVNSWIAVEPAVAAAYAMLGKENPLDVATAIIEGYHGQLPLNDAEVTVLFNFICMRLCMSVCICAYQRSIEPDNEYLAVSEQPAWTLLEKLQNISPEFAVGQFRDACAASN